MAGIEQIEDAVARDAADLGRRADEPACDDARVTAISLVRGPVGYLSAARSTCPDA